MAGMKAGTALRNKFRHFNFMREYFQPVSEPGGDGDSDVYVPKWAQVLIDLYTSPLKYEVLEEMGREKTKGV